MGSHPTQKCFWSHYWFKIASLFCLPFTVLFFVLGGLLLFANAGVRWHCLWKAWAFADALRHPKKLRLVPLKQISSFFIVKIMIVVLVVPIGNSYGSLLQCFWLKSSSSQLLGSHFRAVKLPWSATLCVVAV